MKKNLFASLTLALTLLYFSTFAQQTISELTTNAKEATGDLGIIYDLDVFYYFRLKSYDTELKKSLFKRTEEYQKYLTQLKEIKTEMLKATYYLNPYEDFGNYDINRKGFELYLNLVGDNSGLPPKSLDLAESEIEDADEKEYVESSPSILCGIQLNALPTTQSKDIYLNRVGYGGHKQKLFIPMSESNGLEIENDKENVSLYFFFVPSASGIFPHPWHSYDVHAHTCRIMNGDHVRIVVANKSSGNIYFDKSYSYQPPATKK